MAWICNACDSCHSLDLIIAILFVFIISDGLREDGKISVFNAGRLHSPTGKANNITGYAYVVDPKVPGKLRVVFPSSPAGNCELTSIF